MRRDQHESLSRNHSYYPSQQNHPIWIPFPNWLCPSFPRECPVCTTKLMRQQLSGLIRRGMEERNRGVLAGQMLRMGTMQAHTGAGPSRPPPVAVHLGVLEPRVENGRPRPPTLDLLGLGKSFQGNKDGTDSEKIIIDLDPDVVEDVEGDSSSTGKNKKLKL